NPSDQLLLTKNSEVECIVTPCTFTSALGLRGEATQLGVWRVDLLADGFRLYSDYFSVIPIIMQEEYWNIDLNQSAPFNGHGNLTVTIHPNNQTWSYYRLSMPYAANIT